MNTGQWWNDTDRGKLKYWEKNLSQCYFVHHKSHKEGTWNKSGRYSGHVAAFVYVGFL